MRSAAHVLPLLPLTRGIILDCVKNYNESIIGVGAVRGLSFALMERPVGLRERKKAATRRAIADAALELFVERGFDAVTVRDVAAAADVSATTLFNYFPSKVALIFDDDQEYGERLLEEVKERPAGASVAAALRRHFLSAVESDDAEGLDARRALIEETPELSAYRGQMGLEYKASLAAVIADEAGLAEDDPLCLALASVMLDIWALADTHRDPKRIIENGFDLIEKGWESALAARTGD